MKRYKHFILAFSTLILTACASNGKKTPDIEEIFVTNIHENGTKQFHYTVTTSSDGNSQSNSRKSRGGGRSKGGGRSEGGSQDKVKQMVYTMLDSRLSETGYCRNGYIELDSYFARGSSSIRGECRDGASVGDRGKFPNN